MLHHLLVVWFDWVRDFGYAGVFILMAMESSVIPVPSEVVIPPAAYWAAQGQMNLALVIVAGGLGSLFGSMISYFFGGWVGQPFLRKYGAFVFLPKEKLELAEVWVKKFGNLGIFLARLLPVVRHLISIPAGAFRFPFLRFVWITLGGATLWCIVLAWFGAETIGMRPDLLDSPETMVMAIKAKAIWFIAAVLVLTVLYGAVFRFKKRNAPQAATESS